MARTEERVRRERAGSLGAEPRAAAPPPPASNGPEQPPAPRPRIVSPLRRAILPVLVGVLCLAAFLGALYFIEQAGYVSTDQAFVTGNLVQVVAPMGGQVRAVIVDVGDTVERNQVVATLGGAGQTSSLRAAMDGVVLARYANPGDTVPAGRAILSIVDPTDLWVQAQIDETMVGRVRIGQSVDVTVDSLGATLPGRVLSVGRASSAAISPSPSPAAAPQVRGRQLVPVRIVLGETWGPLVYGGQAFVRIKV